MKNNKGFSLIELIVVIAILGVIAGGTILSTNVVFSMGVKGCTDYLYGYLGKTRIDAMSKASAELEIYRNSNGEYYAKLSTETEETKIGKSPLEISYYINNDTTKYIISDSNILKLSFDRSSGAFLPLEGSANYCEKIIIKGGAKESVILLVPETGKFYIQE